MSGPELITMGCRLNAAESEAMRALAAGEDALIIVNSCAVTNDAVIFFFSQGELLPSDAGATSASVPRTALPPLQLS